MPKKREREFSETLNILNQYYIRSGLYRFVLRNVIKVSLILLVIIVAFWFIEKYIIDIEYLFTTVLKSQKPGLIFLFFGISESLLGLIPPDFFILWTKQFPNPYNAITLLALLSYAGGFISYRIGRLMFHIPRINIYLEKRFKGNIKQLRKWGGIFVVVSALFPLPYSAVSMAVGLIRYPMTPYLLLGLTRIARFYVYAFVLFGII